MHEDKINKLIDHGYDFDMNLYINRGFNIFKSHMWPFIGYAAIYSLISVVGGSIVSLALHGPLVAGFYIVANYRVRGEYPTFDAFFEGFKIFLPLFLANLIIGVFTFVGFIFLVIPGIYLSVAYTFAFPLIIFLHYDFWDAMEASRKLITKNFWPFLGFMAIILLINFGGLLLLGVGLFFTLPATTCMIYAAFEDIVGRAVRD